MKKILYFMCSLIVGIVLFFYLEKQGKNPELHGLFASGSVLICALFFVINPNRLESVEVDE